MAVWYRASDNYRGDCPSALSVDLEDCAPGSLLRGTWPRSKQEVDTPHNEDDPATPKSRLPGRTSDFLNDQSSMIFEPVVQFLFTALTCLFHKQCNRLRARVVINIMFGGSFLPSLWSLRNRSLPGSRSRHCYAITWRVPVKALEPFSDFEESMGAARAR
jgi:hypothetical protein